MQMQGADFARLLIRATKWVQVRNGNACLEWLPTAFPFVEGPRLRIRLPPALSPLRTSFSGGKRGEIRGDDKGRSRRVSTSSGTDGSNPAPSSGESGANLIFGG